MKYLSLIFEFLLLICSFIGLTLQFGVFTNIDMSVIYYYTIISNMLCFIYILIKIIYKFLGKEFIPRFKGSIIMCITVTMLIYHFLLSKTFSMSINHNEIMHYANLLLHYIVPSMIILDSLLFDKKGYYKKIDPIIWLVIPFTYFILSLISGYFKLHKFYDGYYPYFFIDVDKLGIVKVLSNAFLIIVVFTIIGYVIYFIDLKLKKE